MATPDKLLVVQAKDRVVGIEELGMKDDLDAVRAAVEQLHAPDLVQDRVVRVVRHVVRRHGRQRVAAQREDAALEKDLVLL